MKKLLSLLILITCTIHADPLPPTHPQTISHYLKENYQWVAGQVGMWSGIATFLIGFLRQRRYTKQYDAYAQSINAELAGLDALLKIRDRASNVMTAGFVITLVSGLYIQYLQWQEEKKQNNEPLLGVTS